MSQAEHQRKNYQRLLIIAAFERDNRIKCLISAGETQVFAKSPSTCCRLKTAQRGIPLNVDTEGITITVILLPPYSLYFRTRLPYKNAKIKGKNSGSQHNTYKWL